MTVTWNWADNVGGSGIDTASCTTSSVSSGQGAITLSASCRDIAGNTASKTYTVQVDTTPPTLNVPANMTVNATMPAGAVVTYTAPTATDAVGVVTQGCSPLSGSTFGVGTTTVSCTASDAATNVALASFTITVNSAAGQVNSLLTVVTGVGSGSSFATKVQSAQASLAAGKPAVAAAQLQALINEVAAQAEKKVTAAQAAEIIAAAQQIQAALGF